MPKRKLRIADNIRREYLNAFADVNNKGTSVDAVHRIVKIRLKALDLDPPGIDWVYKFKRENFRDDVEVPAWLDESWSIAALVENTVFDPTALPDLLEIGALSIAKGRRFTNRQAIWVGRLRHGVVDVTGWAGNSLGRLVGLANDYANLQRISELTQTPFDTRWLDGWISLMTKDSQLNPSEDMMMKNITAAKARYLGDLPRGLRLNDKYEQNLPSDLLDEAPLLGMPLWLRSFSTEYGGPGSQDGHSIKQQIHELVLTQVDRSEEAGLSPVAARILYLSVRVLLRDNPEWQVPASMALLTDDKKDFSSEIYGWISKKAARIREFAAVIGSSKWRQLFSEPEFVTEADTWFEGEGSND